MGNLLERVRTAVKLRRSRCQECRAVLRGDNTTGTCSDPCAEGQWLGIHALITSDFATRLATYAAPLPLGCSWSPYRPSVLDATDGKHRVIRSPLL